MPDGKTYDRNDFIKILGAVLDNEFYLGWLNEKKQAELV